MTGRPRVARVRAQAKVNLFLQIGPREPDGYHSLFTLFHRLDLADDLVIDTRAAERSLALSGPALPAGGLGPVEENLAMRAATLYAETTGWPDTFAIQLTKNIPAGGGLGGGSADAGAVLRGLDALSDKPLGELALIELGATLGADVAFLASERVAALAHGRGDRLDAPAPGERSLPPRDVLLLIPPFAVSTADAYRWLDESGRQVPAAPGDQSIEWSWEGIARLAQTGLGNDFEPAVEASHPELRDYREWLAASGAAIARLAGSGSTVFGVFDRGIPDHSRPPHAAVPVVTKTAARVVQVEARE